MLRVTVSLKQSKAKKVITQPTPGRCHSPNALDAVEFRAVLLSRRDEFVFLNFQSYF